MMVDFLNSDIPLMPDIKHHVATPKFSRTRLLNGLARIKFVSFDTKLPRFEVSDVLYIEGAAVQEREATLLAELKVVGQPMRYDALDYEIPTKEGECGCLFWG